MWPGVSELQEYKPSFPSWSGKALSTVCPTIGKEGCDLLQVYIYILYCLVVILICYHYYYIGNVDLQPW